MSSTNHSCHQQRFFFIDTHKDENFGILPVYLNQSQSEEGDIASATGGDLQAAWGTIAARLRQWRAEMLIGRNAINQEQGWAIKGDLK